MSAPGELERLPKPHKATDVTKTIREETKDIRPPERITRPSNRHAVKQIATRESRPRSEG